jgi:hypothetical protein
MKTTIEVSGFPELVLSRAVEAGIARSKTDAIRLGILALNSQYGLVQSVEDELVIRKILQVEEENRRLGKKPETTEDVLKKYPHLRNELL